ncbi:CG18178 [Drosophila busckii]|uniref:CG18178 n=1 Tax=Drosophila busckii TaxID=30019 RepID=A0A0M3QW48_DROBS|nr:CG18178 [Drosophila busckii]
MKKKPEEIVTDDDESTEEESAESDNEDELDLAASATESDEDETDEDESGEEDDESDTETPKTKADLIEEQIHNKYEQLKGTRLYVRFPQKLPLDEQEFEKKVKALHPLIAKAAKPRQKHARFCLAEFGSKADRDTALTDIKAAIEKDEAFKGIFVSLPKTDSEDFVNELVARKQQSLEKKKSKSIMKRATKKVQRKETFTSSVLISNLPKTTSVAQVRKLFENAVDIQIKPGKGKFREFNAATVTMPTTYEARNAIKQNLTIVGKKLLLRFNTKQKRRPNKNVKRKATDEETLKVPKYKKTKKAITV